METFNKETREKNMAVKAIYPFRSTGCSLNIVFCEIFKIYSGLWLLSMCTLDFMLGPQNGR